MARISVLQDGPNFSVDCATDNQIFMKARDDGGFDCDASVLDSNDHKFFEIPADLAKEFKGAAVFQVAAILAEVTLHSDIKFPREVLREIFRSTAARIAN